jgi:hypothetical protein
MAWHPFVLAIAIRSFSSRFLLLFLFVSWNVHSQDFHIKETGSLFSTTDYFKKNHSEERAVCLVFALKRQ